MPKPGFKKRYLEKFTRLPRQTTSSPADDTKLIVVIPCFNEPGIIRTLESLWLCERPVYPAEVLIAINQSSEVPEEVAHHNHNTYEEVKAWVEVHQDDKLRFIPLWYAEIKPKIAGVGTGRKLGMDEAVYRFYEIDRADGIIACLDADCTVADNYLVALEAHFWDNPQAAGCSIYFEHPLENAGSSGLYQAILDFELYLRYYKNAFLWTGFPYAYHTIGSVMAVRCDLYQKIGGMNKQKAGEDFYFLEKVIYQGHFTELSTTCVYPSPRKSLRVPFGTGQAVTDYVEAQQQTLYVFNPRAFHDFRAFIALIPDFYQKQAVFPELPASVRDFLQQNNVQYYLDESLVHASTAQVFQKRFFHWFNAFMALKYLHFARDYYYPNIPVHEAVQWVLEKLGLNPEHKSSYRLLKDLRYFDKYLSASKRGPTPF